MRGAQPRRSDSLATRSRVWLAACLTLLLAGGGGVLAQDALQAPMITEWGERLDADAVLPEYPRPRLVRSDWLNLNGTWDFALLPPDAERPERFADTILVPFPVESTLSGVGEEATDRSIWYRRTFDLPPAWDGRRVLLHFGAVDWETHVWVNGQPVGEHRGGYDPFTFDVTDALLPTESQEIVVRVWDPSDGGHQPHGKQMREPWGIWYTPSSGIWQTVWLEPVPDAHIEDVAAESDLQEATLSVTTTIGGGVLAGDRLEVHLFDGDEQIATGTATVADDAPTGGSSTATVDVAVAEPKPWSPDSPFLYDLRVQLWRGNELVDDVESYAGMRTIEIGPDHNGDLRLVLNGEPLFHLGVLDQGFWPDGLYTAPSDDALRFDLEVAKRLGFNMVRKHVKVEPARWYTWADRLGLLVWQDMPSGDAHAPLGGGEIGRDPASAEQFELELERMIDALEHHPSVVVWVLFNEGWGQYDTIRLTDWLQERDPSRLVISASGWNDLDTGDIVDIHAYPGPAAPAREEQRAAVLGEFGGLGLPVAGLTWQDEANWGYAEYEDAVSWFDAYRELMEGVRELQISNGLAAAVYTQITDVETEVNGLLTYDRALLKMDAPRLRSAATELAQPVPRQRALVPASHDRSAPGTVWRYTTEQPGEGWDEPGFDDSGWSAGPGGFGREDSPGAVVRTEWTERDLWLRTSFTLDEPLGRSAFLRVHHDEDIEVYLNGELIEALPYYTFDYVDVPLDDAVLDLLTTGRNVLAAHCRKLAFGQYCDLGLYDHVPPDPAP